MLLVLLRARFEAKVLREGVWRCLRPRPRGVGPAGALPGSMASVRASAARSAPSRPVAARPPSPSPLLPPTPSLPPFSPSPHALHYTNTFTVDLLFAHPFTYRSIGSHLMVELRRRACDGRITRVTVSGTLFLDHGFRMPNSLHVSSCFVLLLPLISFPNVMFVIVSWPVHLVVSC